MDQGPGGRTKVMVRQRVIRERSCRLLKMRELVPGSTPIRHVMDVTVSAIEKPYDSTHKVMLRTLGVLEPDASRIRSLFCLAHVWMNILRRAAIRQAGHSTEANEVALDA